MRAKQPRGGAKSKTSVRKHMGLDNTRWTVQRDGQDFGPFKPQDILEQIEKGLIGEKTRLYEARQDRWTTPSEVPLFNDMLVKLRHKRDRENFENLSREAETRVRNSHTFKWWLSNALVLATLGVGAYFAYSAITAKDTEAAQLERALFAKMELNSIEIWKEPKAEGTFVLPASKKSPSPTRQRKSHAGGTLGGTNSNKSLVATDTPGGLVEESINFEDETIEGGGSPLSQASINAAIAQVTPRIRSCMIKEAQRRADFKGGTVSFALQPSGKASDARLKNAGMVTAALVGCVKRAASTIKISPFSGSQRRVNVPIAVSVTN